MEGHSIAVGGTMPQIKETPFKSSADQEISSTRAEKKGPQ